MIKQNLSTKFTSQYSPDIFDGLLYDGDYSPAVKFAIDLSNGENSLWRLS